MPSSLQFQILLVIVVEQDMHIATNKTNGSDNGININKENGIKHINDSKNATNNLIISITITLNFLSTTKTLIQVCQVASIV